MAINSPLMFITVEEFKKSNYFNNTLFDDITTPDNDIWLAITQASDCVNYASGNNISSKWPEIEPTEFTDIVQTATAHQVRFILGKGVDYMRAQASIAQGGITYQQTNPNDPFYIVPEVYINLSKIKERLTFQGFPINVKPHRSNSFLSGRNDNNHFESYLRITNLQSNDSRTKIIKTSPSDIIGTIVTIDTNNIKGIDNLQTEELFTQYFSNDSMQLVDGKQGQQEKVISISDEVGKLIESKQPLLTSDNAGENITITGSGINVKINAFNRSSDSLWNNTSTDVNLKLAKDINLQGYNLTRVGDPINEDDSTNKRYVDKNLDDKVEIDKFPYAFAVNTIGTEIPNLETTNKTVADAINEINKRQSSGSKWKDVAISQNRETINYELKTNTHYKIFYDVNDKRATGLIGKYPCLISEFYWIYTDGSNFNDLWIDLPHWVNGKLLHLVIVINQHKISWKYNGNDGNFWKLQELQGGD